MKTKTNLLLAAAVFAVAALPFTSAQAKQEKKAVDGPVAAKLLKNVVHLTDDDVRFRTAAGVVVFVDPMSPPADEKVIKSGMVKPDLILITHTHGDHFQMKVLKEYLSQNPNVVLAGPTDMVKTAIKKEMVATELKPGQDTTLAGVSFTTVPAYFTEGNSHPKDKQWMGYVLHLDGANYYVTGDTQALPEMAEIKADVIFPLIFGCGGNTDQAVKMAKLSKARVVVPVHTSGQQSAIDKYLAKNPEGIQTAYFRDGGLVIAP